MRCLTCHYDLSNLTPTESGQHRCPECGNAFDPDDPSTYAVKWSPLDKGVVLSLAVYGSSMTVILFIMGRLHAGIGIVLGVTTLMSAAFLLCIWLLKHYHSKRLP